MYLKKNRSSINKMIASIILLVCLMIYSSTLGVANISFFEAIQIILSKIPFVKELICEQEIDKIHKLIILGIRMPRVVLAAFVGCGLSVVGAVLQGIFRNPMASSNVLGISSGASLGAVIAIILGLKNFIFGMGFITISAFIGAILTTIFVFYIGKVGNKVPTSTLLLSGISVGLLMSSIISIIITFRTKDIDQIVFWMMGSVSAASWKDVVFIFPIVAFSTFILTLFSKELNIMSTGDDTAKSLGVDVEKIKKVMLLISSLIVAACVSVSGVIGFVGLIIPHIVRLIFGYNHRVVIPFSAIGGAVFLVICDTISRTIIDPTEIPVGAITSLFGAPFFIFLLINRKKKVI